MPSTPSIHRRQMSLDYKILISPKKKKHRHAGRCFSSFISLDDCNPSIHDDKVADASSHHKQMENFMRTKIFMLCIKNWQLKRINHASYGVNDSSCQKPSKCSGRKAVQNLRKCKHTGPSHTDI